MGTLYGNPHNLGQAGTGAQLTVVLQTLKSGSDGRDGKMYGMFETDKFPIGTLTVSALRGQPLQDAKPQSVHFDGSLTLRGITQPLSNIPAALTYTSKSVNNVAIIRLRATFVIYLKDYKLKAPRFLFIKVAEDQKITVDLAASEQS